MNGALPMADGAPAGGAGAKAPTSRDRIAGAVQDGLVAVVSTVVAVVAVLTAVVAALASSVVAGLPVGAPKPGPISKGAPR